MDLTTTMRGSRSHRTRARPARRKRSPKSPSTTASKPLAIRLQRPLAHSRNAADPPTLMLGEFLFANGGRHVTADMIYTEAAAANMPISRATVYNTLNQFTEAACCARSASTDRNHFSIPTPARIIISSSITKTGCSTCPHRGRDRAAAGALAGLRDFAGRRHPAFAPEAGMRGRQRRIRDAVGIATIGVKSKNPSIAACYANKKRWHGVAVHELRAPASASLKLPLW